MTFILFYECHFFCYKNAVFLQYARRTGDFSKRKR